MKSCTSLIASLMILGGGVSATVLADTAIVNEDFQSYADTAALQAQWVGTDTNIYRLATNAENPDAFATGEQGAEHLGGVVAIWNTSFGGPLANGGIEPSATQKVVLKADIYDDHTSGNKRVSVGLRQAAGVGNLFEMGMYNTVPGPVYMFRMVSFPGATLDANNNGGWMAFHDLVDDSGTPITPPAAGGNASVLGWHQLSAAFEVNKVTVTLDLNRDGNINATSVIPYTNLFAGGFQQLRFGGPSGVASAGGSLTYDNIMLSLVDIVSPGLPGDYNVDGKVNAADYVLWRSNPGAFGGDPAGYITWRANFGNPPGSGSGLVGGGAVPEPAATVMLLLGIAALVSGRRGKR